MMTIAERYEYETGKSAYILDDWNNYIHTHAYVKWLEERLDDLYHEDRFDD